MIELIPIAALLAWLGWTALAPTTRKGGRSVNSITGITLPAKDIDAPGRTTRFVKVQEVGEWRAFKLIAWLIVAVLFAVGSGADPVALAFAVSIGLFLAELLVRKVFLIDYAGKGAELIAAKKALGPDEFEAYRVAEIDSIVSEHGGTYESAARRLEGNTKLARIIYRLGK